MKYDEVSDIIDGSNLVGYGRFNPDHITAVEQFKTMEKKWNTYRECINQILQLLLNGKSCMSKGYLSDIFGTLENPKEFNEEKLFAED